MTVELLRRPPPTAVPPGTSEWLRLAHRARLLSWLSLGWMTVEGAVAIVAGIVAGSNASRQCDRCWAETDPT